jgi:flagellar hook-length control protein FliK
MGGSANGAEMHVELRSGSLGPMEVHAVVHEGSVGAEIHVESHAAHAILSAGVPSLERALGEQDLRVGNIAIYQDHGGAGMSDGGRQDPHSGAPPTPQQQVAHIDTPARPSRPSSGTLEIENMTNSAGGLNVRA